MTEIYIFLHQSPFLYITVCLCQAWISVHPRERRNGWVKISFLSGLTGGHGSTQWCGFLDLAHLTQLNGKFPSTSLIGGCYFSLSLLYESVVYKQVEILSVNSLLLNLTPSVATLVLKLISTCRAAFRYKHSATGLTPSITCHCVRLFSCSFTMVRIVERSH